MDATDSLGEPRALIDGDALLHNARQLRGHLPPQTKICAIVKADAYGHGAEAVVRALCDAAADADHPHPCPPIDALAVATIDEAAALPETALGVWILRPVENVYVGRQRERLEEAIRRGWVLTLATPAAADDVARIAMACRCRASVQVMIDTGMTRAGADIANLEKLLGNILHHPALKLTALGTHFVSSEQPGDPLAGAQLRRYLNAVESGPVGRLLQGRNIIHHAANSGGILFHPDAHLDMVRPGLSLYGIDPTCRPSMDRPLRPALRWTAPLIGVREVKKGTGVGYGHAWQAERDTRIGLVPVGYADGYLRACSNRAVMMIDGRPAPVVGRVSMDMTTIDLGQAPEARVGDEVTLLDSDPLSPASVYALARLADTIPYEIFCRIGPRVQRILCRSWQPAGQSA